MIRNVPEGKVFAAGNMAEEISKPKLSDPGGKERCSSNRNTLSPCVSKESMTRARSGKWDLLL